MSFVNGFLSARCTDFLDQIEYLHKLRRAYSTVISAESAQKDGKLFDWFPFSFYFTVFSFNIPLSPRELPSLIQANSRLIPAKSPHFLSHSRR